MTITSRLRKEYGLAILLGFEIEVVFMKPVGPAGSRAPLCNHSWCNLTSEDASILQMIEEVVRKLHVVDAAAEIFHAESAPGQWEFVLSPRTPVEAVDMLLRARETITVIAYQHGLRCCTLDHIQSMLELVLKRASPCTLSTVFIVPIFMDKCP